MVYACPSPNEAVEFIVLPKKMSKYIYFMTFRGTFEALFYGIFSKNDKFDSLNIR